MRLAALATAAALSLTAAASASSCTDGEVPYVRTYFYAGGQYVDDGNGGKIFRDQMYVEKLVPARGVTRTTPVVLIHGQAQTGTVSSFRSFAPLILFYPLPKRCSGEGLPRDVTSQLTPPPPELPQQA